MAAFKIGSTLVNREAAISTVWSTIQQLVVASSTFFILRAIQSSTEGDMHAALHFIAAFVASLILVFVPMAFAMVYLQKWRLASIDAFLTEFVRSNYGKTTLGHTRNKVHSEAYLTNESFTVYDYATNLLFQLYSTFMNSALNIIVIAAALDWRILFWYVLAGLFLVVSSYASKTNLTKASLDAQSSRKNLSNAMLTAWDNILIGNRHNYLNWKQNYSDRLDEAQKSASRTELIRSVISSLAVAVALLIVATGNGIFLFENSNKLPAVAALIITLPRQLQIIQSIFGFFNLALAWTGTKAQLLELQNAARLSHGNKRPEQFIQFGEIELSSDSAFPRCGSLAEVTDALLSRTNGRYTLRGRNGAGKSTLLSLIKEDFGDRAFYLPTNYADLAFNTEFIQHSDGNRLLSVFNNIASLNDLDFVILDEWDANLDAANIAKVSEAIENLAKSKIVIESRHRS